MPPKKRVRISTKKSFKTTSGKTPTTTASEILTTDVSTPQIPQLPATNKPHTVVGIMKGNGTTAMQHGNYQDTMHNYNDTRNNANYGNCHSTSDLNLHSQEKCTRKYVKSGKGRSSSTPYFQGYG